MGKGCIRFWGRLDQNSGFALIAEKTTFDLGTLDSDERLLLFGLLVNNLTWRGMLFTCLSFFFVFLFFLVLTSTERHSVGSQLTWKVENNSVSVDSS